VSKKLGAIHIKYKEMIDMKDKSIIVLAVLIILISCFEKDIFKINIEQIDPDYNDIEKYKYLPYTKYRDIPFHRFPKYHFSENTILASYQNEYYKIDIYDIDVAGIWTDQIPLGGIYMSITNLSNEIIKFVPWMGIETSPCIKTIPEHVKNCISISASSAAWTASGKSGSFFIMTSTPINKNIKDKIKDKAFSDENWILPGDKKTGIIYYDWAYDGISSISKDGKKIYIDDLLTIRIKRIYLMKNGQDVPIESDLIFIHIPEDKIKYWYFIQRCQCSGRCKPMCGDRDYNYTGKIGKE